MKHIGCGSTVTSTGAVERTWQCDHVGPWHRLHRATLHLPNGVPLATVRWVRAWRLRAWFDRDRNVHVSSGTYGPFG